MTTPAHLPVAGEQTYDLASTSRRRDRWVQAAVMLVTALAAVHCGPAPGAKTAANWQLTEQPAGQCKLATNASQPLVVDWDAHLRGDLEDEMKEGVAVVSYDCKSLRLLKGCHVDGSYRFSSFSKKEQSVRFENADEVGVNLPGFGIPLLRGLRGELREDTTLDLAMILVGKRRATRRTAAPQELAGGQACEGATHFIRGAFVGAFALGTGSRLEANLGLGLFSASRQTSRLGRYRDGDPKECQQADPYSEAPPASCSALLRLELIPLGTEDEAWTELEPNSSCPSGFVLSQGKCAKATADQVPLCARDDRDDCQQKCDQGNSASCFALGYMYGHGRGVEKNDKKAFQLYERACSMGERRACSATALSYSEGTGTSKDASKSAEFYRRACEGGEHRACNTLGAFYLEGNGVKQDIPEATRLFRVACDADSAEGCYNLGAAYDAGRGLEQDLKRAAFLYQKSCEGAFARGCAFLGLAYAFGNGVKQDDAKAFTLLERACSTDDRAGCWGLGFAYEKGLGTTMDEPRALGLYGRSCTNGSQAACTRGGLMVAEGRGTPKDTKLAFRLFKQGCDQDYAEACYHLAGLYERGGTGVMVNRSAALLAYKKACSGQNEEACLRLNQIGKKR